MATYIICNRHHERMWQYGPFEYYDIALKVLYRAMEMYPQAGLHIVEL